MLESPRSRSSFTRRSCRVPFARSTRPLACGLLAQRLSMLSSRSARPNWERPGPRWARHQQPGGGHPAAQRFDREREAMLLGQLLVGEGGPEIRIALADERQGVRLRRGREPARARPAALARDEPVGTVAPERPIEPPRLALAEPQQRRGVATREPPFRDADHQLQPIQFLHAQGEVSAHPGTVPEKRTSLLWRNRTFALWAYMGGADRQGYVNFGP